MSFLSPENFVSDGFSCSKFSIFFIADENFFRPTKRIIFFDLFSKFAGSFLNFLFITFNFE